MYTDAAPEGASGPAPLSSDAVELLTEAEAVAMDEGLEVAARVKRLRTLLTKVNPSRRRVAVVGRPEVKVAMPLASPLDLLTAIRSDIACSAAFVRPPKNAFKEVEATFRVGGAADSSAPSSADLVAGAVAAGAYDFGSTAAWRTDAALQERLGIVQVCPPAPACSTESPPPTGVGSVMPRGGIYTLASVPGFYHLPGLLTPTEQAYWVRRTLRTYIEPPNRRNIDADLDPDYSNLVRDGPPPGTAAAAATTAAVGGAGSATAGMGTSSHQEVMVAPVGDARFRRDVWAEYVRACKEEGGGWAEGRVSKGGVGGGAAMTTTCALAGVSWATLGYQYDWTGRVYHLPSDPDYHLHARGTGGGTPATTHRWSAPFPADLWCWSRDVAACVHRHAVATLDPDGLDESAFDHGLPMSIDAHSGICNLYHAVKKQPMGAHIDDMERDYAFPVVSVSFGCTAVYLLGGATRDVAPIPLLLRSGDVALLSGGCRLAFHGVARVYPDTTPHELHACLLASTPAAADGGGVPTLCPPPPPTAMRYLSDVQHGPYAHPAGLAPGEPEERAAFARFLAAYRININVRQVQTER